MSLYSKQFEVKETISGRRLVEGGIYHVIQRAPGSDVLFLEDDDYLNFLRLLKEIKKKFDLEVLCFCLMTNHVHILLKINKVNLSQAMKSLFMQYAMSFNEKYKRKGHVFCGKYKSFLCFDERYLITVSVYVHLNAYKAGLAQDPFEYRWTSLNAYWSLPEKTFLNYDLILDVFCQDKERARYKYKELIEGCSEVNFKVISKEPRNLRKKVNALFSKVEDMLQREIYKENLVRTDKKGVKKRIRAPEAMKARKYQIKQLLAQGYQVIEIAEILSLSRQSIYNALKK